MAIFGMSNSQIALINFKNRTQRDLSAYPTFNSKKYYNAFHHPSTLLQGHKVLGKFLTPNSAPNTMTPLLICFFIEQQFFIYSVLVVTLQTETRKEFTKEFEDAQQILVELHDYHAKSEMTQHKIVELTTYITNISLTIPGMGHHDSSLHISRRNYAYWIAWGKNLTNSKDHTHHFSPASSQLTPFLTFARFTS